MGKYIIYDVKSGKQVLNTTFRTMNMANIYLNCLNSKNRMLVVKEVKE